MTNALMHCFGTRTTPPVDAPTAARMLIASGLHEVPVNTHCIDEVDDWRDLPLGFGSASWRTVSNILNLSSHTPIWNINHAATAAEAIARTTAVLRLGGRQPIKLEVLDTSRRWSDDSAVVAAVAALREQDSALDVWPLVSPDPVTFSMLQRLGCRLVRVMGSPIGSGLGLATEHMPSVLAVLAARKNETLMLDGGVGEWQHVENAFRLGFDRVLLNSCLFGKHSAPDELLQDWCARAVPA